MKPDDVIKYLDSLAKFIQESQQEMQVLVSGAMLGIMTKRIFNNQQGSENSFGTNLGVYTPAYAKAKAKKYGTKLSTKVNLYASGTLFGSTKQVQDKGNTYISVSDVKYPKGQNTVEVSNYIDKQYGETFAPTESETDKAIALGTKFINRKVEQFTSK